MALFNAKTQLSQAGDRAERTECPFGPTGVRCTGTEAGPAGMAAGPGRFRTPYSASP